MENLFGEIELDHADIVAPVEGPFAAVALEQGIDRLLDYSVPRRLAGELQVGQLVKVPLGRKNKLVKGYVIAIRERTDYPKVKPIAAIADERVLVAGKLLELARWMSRYYVTPLGVVLDSVIPSAVKKQVGVGYTKIVKLAMRRDAVQEILEKTKARKRRAVLARLLLLEAGQGIELAKLAGEAGTTPATVRKLAKAGVITVLAEADFVGLSEVQGSGFRVEGSDEESDLELNEEQAKVMAALAAKLPRGVGVAHQRSEVGDARPTFSVTLLHGVTGSGKTEIYLQCIRRVIEAGKQAIVLVPEIALTPQTVRRFTARFRRVAVLHSGLSATARHRYWQQISVGLADVVVGARSAIFAPVPELGIIVVDEEHEASYKQDTAPRYQARDVAIKRGQIEQVPVVLGSATPSLESYFKASDEATERRSDEGGGGRRSDEATKRRSDEGEIGGGSGGKEIGYGKGEDVSGSDCLAEGDGVGANSVSGDPSDAGVGTVRPDEPDAASGGFRAVEHRGGSCASEPSGLSEVPANCAGVAGGVDDANGTGAVDENAEARTSSGSVAGGGGSGAPGPDRGVGEEAEGMIGGSSLRRSVAQSVLIAANGSLRPFPPLRRSVASSLRRYHLLSLPHRVRGLQLPYIELVDMKQANRFRKGIHLISQRLEQLIKTTVEAKQQAILLLNRRGYSNFVYCVSCGNVVSCKYCDTTMTYHRAAGMHPAGASSAEGIHTGQLHCHYCLAVNPLPAGCPVCGKKLSLFGLGTQRVEEEIGRKFPNLRYARVDSDSMRSGRDYEQILGAFGRGELDMLLGTQMIAKGLDYPNVTLVGVVSGDTALALPDFRASERTFQLITQVAGRAGRGDSPGRVVLQTFQPDDPTIQAAIRQDYPRFAATELKHRREVGLPPFTRMVRIVLRDQEQEKLFKLSEELGAALNEEAAKEREAVTVKGPMPCAINRIAGYHRNQVVLTSAHAGRLQRILAAAREKGALSKTDRIAVDVDPVSLL